MDDKVIKWNKIYLAQIITFNKNTYICDYINLEFSYFLEKIKNIYIYKIKEKVWG